MPQNLFAACRDNGGQLIAKRVRLDAAVQQAIEAIFADQEAAFRHGVTSEVPSTVAGLPMRMNSSQLTYRRRRRFSQTR